MERINWKGSALLAPLPVVLVTSAGTAENGDRIQNVCTVGWTGIINTNPAKTYISLRPSRLTHELVSKSREFCINIPSSRLVRIVDFCGVRSGREVNKLADLNLTPIESAEVGAPSIEECPVVLECRVSDVTPLGSHDMFVADIVNVSVRPELLNESGRLALEKAGLFCYVHGSYFALGKKIGSFGYSVKNRKKQRRK